MERLIFTQNRVGKGGELFQMHKIQTMYSGNTGLTSPYINKGDKPKNDPGIIPSRNWMRKTGIDELPQIVNIILGDMSFFGPRAISEKVFSSMTSAQRNRYIQHKPGIFGEYVFYKRRFCGTNRIRCRDAYIRLENRKKDDFFGLTSLRLFSLYKSIQIILQGEHR